MLFNTYIFIFAFLPITLLGYFGLHKIKKTYSCKSIFMHHVISVLWLL